MDPTGGKMNFIEVDGIFYPPFFLESSIKEAISYKPKQEDVFIVTYPKCGTTWSQMIVLYILHKGVPLKEDKDFMAYCPYLELSGVQGVKKMPGPGVIMTHLPFSRNPYSPEAKYINVCRNPKDCCVSLYHHSISVPGAMNCDISFDDFFELFMAGNVFYGDYFEYTLSWLEHHDNPNVLFVAYEDMKKDTRGAVAKIAKFLGKEYEEALEIDPLAMDNILHYSSFSYMKEHTNKIFNIFNEVQKEDFVIDPSTPAQLRIILEKIKKATVNRKSKTFTPVRKGVVGGWRNYFSREQSRRMDQRFTETLGHTLFADLWKDDMKYDLAS